MWILGLKGLRGANEIQLFLIRGKKRGAVYSIVEIFF